MLSGRLIEVLKMAARSVKKEQVLPAVALDLLKLSLKEDSFQLFWNNAIINGMLKEQQGPTQWVLTGGKAFIDCYRGLRNIDPNSQSWGHFCWRSGRAIYLPHLHPVASAVHKFKRSSFLTSKFFLWAVGYLPICWFCQRKPDVKRKMTFLSILATIILIIYKSRTLIFDCDDMINIFYIWQIKKMCHMLNIVYTIFFETTTYY